MSQSDEPDRVGPGPSPASGDAPPPEPLGPALSRVCRDAVAALDLDGAVVTVMAQNAAEAVLGSSDDAATEIAQIPLAVGEGPTLDAYTLRRPVLTSDLADAVPRWPGYATEALRAGVCSVFAFPLQLGASRFGVLTCWNRRARTLAARETTLLLALAELITQTMLDPARDGSDGGRTAQIDHALHLPHEVYQAQGMAMVQLGVSLAEALDRIRGHAFATGQDLATLSRSIVDGTTRLHPDRPSERSADQ